MEVSLSKDGWHRKLQVWTFGSKTPNFNSLCPFFWLTVFCLLVSPVVATVKYGVILPLRLVSMGLEVAVGWLLKGVELFVDAFNTGVCQPIYEQRVESVSSSLSDDEAYELYRTVCFIDEHPVVKFSLDYITSRSYKDEGSSALKRSASVILDQLKAWQNKNPDWESRLAAARARYKQAQALMYKQAEADRLAKQAREERLKKFFNTVALYTKYPLALVLGVIAIYIVYGLALVALWLYECSGSIASFFVSAFNWIIEVIVERGPLALAVMAGILGAVALIVLAAKLLSKCTLFHTGRKQGRFSRAMTKLGDGLYSFVEFFVMYAKAAKQNYCPRINWK